MVPVRAGEDDVLALSRLPMRASGSSGSSGHVDAGWMTAPGTARFVLPLARLELPALAPDHEYQLRVAIERPLGARDAAPTAKSLDIARITIRTTRAGLLWPY